jgi:DNA polymerase III epsilon subunit family exonuclease
MNWRDLPIVAFDTETTGLNPHDGDRVIEFAAVRMWVDDKGYVDRVEPFQILFNPGIPIPRKVTEITGIDDDTVADADSFESHAKEIREILQGAICVAHNFPFDRAFLTVEFRRNNLPWPDPVAEIDTVDLSMRWFKGARSHKLADVAARLEVSLEGAHRASNDAEACGRCFTELARRYDAPENLDGMLDWADALGRPPKNEYLGRGGSGVLEYWDGPHRGLPVEERPVHLQWMTYARVRQDNAWAYRFPESLRRWAERFLRVRCSGRARQNPKSFGPGDWTIDSNALPLPLSEANDALASSQPRALSQSGD